MGSFKKLPKTSKPYFVFCKLEIYMLEYQQFTAIKVWEIYRAKIEVCTRLQPLHLKGCRYMN